MSGYAPYLVGDMRHGLDIGVQPWLLPSDAFSSIKNGYLYRGVLQKRLGYTQWDRFVHAVDDEAIGSSGTDNYTGTISNLPLRAGDLSFTDGTLDITDDGDGTLSGDGTGTIDYTTGAYDITFSGSTTGAVTADYDYYPGNPIMGIESYYPTSGAQDFLIWDTKRVCKYDETEAKLEDISGTDTWTGDSGNYFWVENWNDVLFATNNLDRLKIYSGTTFSDLLMDIDGDASNDVGTCLMIFAYKERIVILRTTEGGTVYPQRARWCKAGDHTNWIDGDSGGQGGYVDAPTLDWIVAADFIGDDLVVFFERSVWKFKYTANATQPFRWEKVTATEGSYSTFGTAPFADEIITISATSMIATDGLDTYAIDKKYPDFAINIDQAQFEKSFAAVIEESRQIIVLYPSIGADDSDEAAVINYEDNAWSIWDYPFTAVGYYSESNDLTLDSVDVAIDDLEITFDDRTQQAGFPTTLAGNTSGYIYQINSGGSDDGSAIEFDVSTGRLNPFIKKGLRARLGYVDFLVDRDPDIDLTVYFYQNQESSPYLTETFPLESESNEEGKIWIRVYCGSVADFHKIRMYNNETNQTVAIHAIMYWFKSAGRIK